MKNGGEMAKIDEIKKWAKGKPLGLVMIAQQSAVGAEPCFQFLKLVKAGERIEVLSYVPNVKEWLRLYRNHRRIQRSLIESFKEFVGIAEYAAYLAES